MEQSVSFVFVGDFCSYFPDKLKVGTNLKNLLDKTDFNFINFEGPLQIGEKHTPTVNYLRQSVDSPKWCEDNKFNIIGLSNNHSFDFGESGLKATYKSFTKKNTLVLGCGFWDDVYKVEYIKKNGIIVGLLPLTSSDFSSLKDKWTDFNKYGCAYINHPSIDSLITEAKKECDYLIVLPHVGVEFITVPLPEWRERYYSLIDAGADAIVASHPHVPQGMEYYKDKPVFYSLGNFAFEKDYKINERFWYNGLLVYMNISKTGVFVNTYFTKLENHIVDIDKTEDSAIRFKNMCEVLGNDEEYINEVNRQILENYQKYENWLLSGLSSVKCVGLSFDTMKNIIKKIIRPKLSNQIALHQIREDSTRYLLTRAYKLKTGTIL